MYVSASGRAGGEKKRRKKRKPVGDEVKIEGLGRREEREATRMRSMGRSSQLRYGCSRSLQRCQEEELKRLKEHV